MNPEAEYLYDDLDGYDPKECCGTCESGAIDFEYMDGGDYQCWDRESHHYKQYMCYDDYCDYWELEDEEDY
jgi:hypothetical protein